MKLLRNAMIGTAAAVAIVISTMSAMSILSDPVGSQSARTRKLFSLRGKNQVEKWPDLGWMLSFPNSGSSYLTHVVETVSKNTMATNYGPEIGTRGKEMKLSEYGPEGPFRYSPTPLPPNLILTKSHCYGYCLECGAERNIIDNPNFLQGCTTGHYPPNDEGKTITRYSPTLIKKIVHLIRDPFDNIVARYYHQRNHGRTFDRSWGYSYGRSGFLSWCLETDKKFSENDPRWTSSEQIVALASQIPCHGPLYQYVNWHNHAFQVSKENNIPFMVFHYADFRDNLQELTTSLFEFLDLTVVGQSAPFIFQGYNGYFSKEEIMAIAQFVKVLASQRTWDNIQQYFPNIEPDQQIDFSPLANALATVDNNIDAQGGPSQMPEQIQDQGMPPPDDGNINQDQDVLPQNPEIVAGQGMPPPDLENINPESIPQNQSIPQQNPEIPSDQGMPPPNPEDILNPTPDDEPPSPEEAPPTPEIQLPDGESWPDVAWMVSYNNFELTIVGSLIMKATGTTIASNHGTQALLLKDMPNFAYQGIGPFRISELPFPNNFIVSKTTCIGQGSGPENRNKYTVKIDSFITQCAMGKAPIEKGSEIVNIDTKVFKKMVHIIRNPFDNIVGEFHLEYRQQKNKFPYTFDGSGFQNWCKDNNAKVKSIDHIYYGVKTDPLLKASANVPCHSAFFKYMMWHNLALELPSFYDLPVLTVHYDDLSTKRNVAVPELFDFLGLEVENTNAELELNDYRGYFSEEDQVNVATFLRMLGSAAVGNHLERYLPKLNAPTE